MSNWDQVRESFSRWGHKVNAAVEDVADQTALQIRLMTRRHDLEKEYATLGKLTYQKLTPDALPSETEDPTPADELTEQINQALTRITAILAEIEELEKKPK